MGKRWVLSLLVAMAWGCAPEKLEAGPTLPAAIKGDTSLWQSRCGAVACQAEPGHCGYIVDPCGDLVQCGGCGDGEGCGAGGVPAQCAPLPEAPALRWAFVTRGAASGIASTSGEELIVAVSAPSSRLVFLGADGSQVASRALSEATSGTLHYRPEAMRGFAQSGAIFLRGVYDRAGYTTAALDSLGADGRLLHIFSPRHFASDFAVAPDGRIAFITPEGERVLVFEGDKAVQVIETVEGAVPSESAPTRFGGVDWLPDGDLLVLGQAALPSARDESQVPVSTTVFVAQVASNGTTRWQRAYAGLGATRLDGLERAADGSLHLIGHFHGGMAWGSTPAWTNPELLVADAEGTPLWTARFSAPLDTYQDLIPRAVEVGEDGTVVALLPHRGCSGFTARRISAAGAVEWDKTFLSEACSGDLQGLAITRLGDEVIVSGTITRGAVMFGGERYSPTEEPLGFVLNLGR